MLAVAGGLLLFAGHPPLRFGPIGLVALVPLLALARDIGRGPRPLRAGFGWGVLTGTAFFAPLLYWIAHVEVVALPLLVATQAMVVGVFVAGLAAWGERPWRPAAAVVWWVGLEAARSAFPWGGFPWGGLGYTQHDGGMLLPLARTLGVLGVGLACALVAVCVEESVARVRRALAEADRADTGVGETVFGAARVPLIGVLVILASAVVIGGDPPPDTGRRVDVAAVQGNDIADTRSLTRSRVLAVAERMVALTEQLAAQGLPDVVVWPENALDGDVRTGDNPELAALLDRGLRSLEGTPLLTGLLLEAPERGSMFNTMAQLGPGGQIVDVYAKRSLVPFGEFVPLREYLGWFPPLERAGDFRAGGRPGVFTVGDVRLGTVICFENNFPELTRSQVRAGAQVLVVSTNNASFGRSPASSQHLAFSQLRAVESGRWVLHAGISGISAVIDPQGRIHERTGLFEQAVVRAELPLVDGDTVFTRIGDVVGPVAMLLAGVGALGLAVARWRGRPDPR